MVEKYIITYNAGWGETAEIIEANTLEKACMAAYEAAREEFENNADYGAEPYSTERAEELGID